MLPEERDAAYLWDMLEAVKAIVEFTQGVTPDQFLEDRKDMLITQLLRVSAASFTLWTITELSVVAHCKRQDSIELFPFKSWGRLLPNSVGEELPHGT